MKLFFLVFAALSFVANPAKAETHLKNVASWDIKFADKYCSARSIYRNQNVAFIIIPWEEKLTLQIDDPRWNIPEGDYDVHFRVDSVQSYKKAQAIGNTSMFMDFALNKSVFQLFQQGREMWVTAKSGEWGYILNNTQIMLPELVQCAIRLKKVMEAKNVNPFGSPNSTNTFGGTSNPFDQDLETVDHNPFK